MPFRSAWRLLALVVVLASPPDATAQVILQTRDLRLEIDANGPMKSLTARTSGVEYLASGPPAPAAIDYVRGVRK